ncbi:hypothetical protein HK405_003660, partial [Cladochytrium tenue]
NENARFEADIIQVDNNTALADLVTESSDSVDAVMRVIESLSSHQSLLEATVANRNESDDDDLWTDAIDANWLPLDTSLFLGGLVINDNFEAIHVVETDTFDPIALLKLLVGIIKPSSQLADSLTDQERVRLEKMLRRQSEEKLVSAADTLSTILKALVVDPKAMEKLGRTSTLFYAIVSLAPTMGVTLTEALPLEMGQLQMKNMKDIAEMVIEFVDGKGYLFTSLPIELDQPLSPEVAEFLSEKLSELSSDCTGYFKRSMRSLSEHLRDEINSLRPRIGISLLQIVRATHRARNYEWDDCWTEVLSETILVENLGAFLRFLLKCGSLSDVDGESILYHERVPDGGPADQRPTDMEVDIEPAEQIEETEAVVLADDMIVMREMADSQELGVALNFRVKPLHGTMFLSSLLQCLMAVDSVQRWLSVPGDTESPLSGPLRRILQESRRASNSVLDPMELLTKLKGLDTKYTGRKDILVYALFQDLLKFHAGLTRLVTIRRTERVACEECGAATESEDLSNCADVPVGNSEDISIDEVSVLQITKLKIRALSASAARGPKEDVESASEPMGDFQHTGTSTSRPEVPTLAATVSANAGNPCWVSVLDEDKEAEFAARVLGASDEILNTELLEPEELPVPASVSTVSALKRLLAEDKMFATQLVGVHPSKLRVYQSASDFFGCMRRRVDPTAAPTGRGGDGWMPSSKPWLSKYGEHAEDPVVIVIPRRS